MAAPLALFPYQEIGAAFLARSTRAGLFDEMGLGKTATAIRAVDTLGAERGMIVAPAAVREVWRNEFTKFSTRRRRVVKGISIHDYTAWARGQFDVIVTSYDLATKWAELAKRDGELMDFLVFDEAHYLKNTSAKRTKALIYNNDTGLAGMEALANYSWELSGTPMANDPSDIYSFLRFARLTDLGRSAFCHRYFTQEIGTYSVRNEPRPEMLGELQTLIGARALRRTLRDVEIDLPPIHLTQAVVDGDDSKVKDLLREAPHLSALVKEAVETGDLHLLTHEYVSTLRRLLGEAKAVPFAHMLLEDLRSGLDKSVVMGIHRDALRYVRDFLLKHNVDCVLVNGDTPEAMRAQAQHRFQNDKECRVFLGNIRTAGTGLTLTSSADISILEPDWSPAGNAQALKRVHRIGQSRKVRARIIVLAGSFDEIVTEIVERKTRAIIATEGGTSPLDSLLRTV